METVEIVEYCINYLGYPAFFICVLLYFYKTEFRIVRESIDNNTLILQELLILLKKE